jgi:hypothetical protein
MKATTDVWASMQDNEIEKLKEYKKLTDSIKSKQDGLSVVKLMSKTEKKEKKVKKTAAEKKIDSDIMLHNILNNQLGDAPKILSTNIIKTKTSKKKSTSIISNNLDKIPVIDKEIIAEIITSAEMMTKISRDINAINSTDNNAKKKSLISLYDILFVEYTMSSMEYSEVFHDICKTIFKKFTDPVEKCREMSLKITSGFFERATDLVSILGYFIPAIMQRMPSGVAYDEEMKVFVTDIETHEAFRRGKAVERQDKNDLLNHTVIESSEEIRLLTCMTFHCLIRKMCEIGASSVLHPYFHEIVMFLQLQLRDPYPELKMEACNALEYLSYQEEYVSGMKFFAVALVRAILPVLRHRHAKVRVAAVTSLKGCMIVPDRAKMKGSGTEAIFDLVGFREENVLQVAAFYTTQIQINYLAELAVDKSVLVREKVADMLHCFLTELGDRYDHQNRLLPYLLDLLTDDTETVSNIAMNCLHNCGQQYEEEHPKDIIENRQYGVDGDDRINLDKSLPPPFKERPRMGIRLYVRGNTKRFLTSLVGELTNWQSKTRYKSAQLLKVIVILCEEHLTMEAHTLLPAFIKALGFAKQDNDKELYKLLIEVYELVGRFMLPDTYIHYILPRLRGDRDIVQFGTDTHTRVTVLEFLSTLLQGTKPSLVPIYFEDIVEVLTDPFIIDPESSQLPAAALDVFLILLSVMQERGKAAIEGHFLKTGRLTSLKSVCFKVFKTLMIYLPDSLLHNDAVKGLKALAYLDTDPAGSITTLIKQHGGALLATVIDDYEIDSDWKSKSIDHTLLSTLIECPMNVLYSSLPLFVSVIDFLCVNTSTSHSSLPYSVENEFLESFSSLFCSTLIPLCEKIYQSNSHLKYKGLIDGSFKYDGEEIEIDVNEGIWPGAGVSEEKLSYLTSKINDLLQAFIFDSRWSRSPKLLSCRINVLSTLIGISTSSIVSSNINFIANDKLLSVMINLTSDVVTPSLQPTCPAPLRFASIELQNNLISLIVSYRSGSNTSSIKSFIQQKNTPFTNKCKENSQLSISLMLNCLNDSSDNVRLSALSSLTNSVSLIKEDLSTSTNNIPIDNDGNSLDLTSLTNDPTKPVYFTDISTKLLLEITSSLHEDEYLLTLDGLLRSVAVLEPKLFEEIVRSKLNTLLVGKHIAPSKTSDMLSGLIDHCEMMIEFNSRK